MKTRAFLGRRNVSIQTGFRAVEKFVNEKRLVVEKKVKGPTCNKENSSRG